VDEYCKYSFIQVYKAICWVVMHNTNCSVIHLHGQFNACAWNKFLSIMQFFHYRTLFTFFASIYFCLLFNIVEMRFKHHISGK